jgi:hypothetical protein
MEKPNHSRIKEGLDPHEHKKKTWLVYSFEFFMLFLAVFCGFQAEYLLEHKIERDKEREFIVSMVKELKIDSAQLANVSSDSTRYMKVDTLALRILGGDRSLSSMKKIYDLYYNYAINVVKMQFNKTTLTELKNAGNMRLIQNKNVVDSLNALAIKISDLEMQWDAYADLALNNYKFGSKVLDRSYMIEKGKWIEVKDFLENARSIDFLTNDKAILKEFGNMLKAQSSVLKEYFSMLRGYSEFSTTLTSYLIKEYRLKNL